MKAFIIIAACAAVITLIVHFFRKKQRKQEEAIVNLVAENFSLEELEAASTFLRKNRNLFQTMVNTAPFYFDKDRLPLLLEGLVNLTITEKKNAEW